MRRTNLSLSFLPSPSKSFFSSFFFCGRLTNNLLSPRCFRLLPFSLFPCTHCGNANCKGKKERGALGNSSIYVFLSLSLSLSLFLGRVRERGKKRTGLSGETRGGSGESGQKSLRDRMKVFWAPLSHLVWRNSMHPCHVFFQHYWTTCCTITTHIDSSHNFSSIDK